MSVTPVNERLAALTAAGTSVWLDQIRRGMIESGELERMVVEESLRGVTSNPAIFEKAILGSPDYDDDLAEAAREGLSAREVYRRLAVRDVQLAADVLRPVYDETRRRGRLRVARGGAAARARHGGHARAGAPVLGARRPAQRDDQDPGDGRGRARDRAGALRGSQRQHDPSVRRLRLREGDGGVHRRDGAPAGGGPAARPPLRRLLLRLPRGHGGRQAARGARPQDLQGRAGLANARAAYKAFRARVRRPALRRPGRRRLPRAAPAVGLDRASRTRSTPRRCTSTGSSPRTRSTRCRCPRCRRPRRAAR